MWNAIDYTILQLVRIDYYLELKLMLCKWRQEEKIFAFDNNSLNILR